MKFTLCYCRIQENKLYVKVLVLTEISIIHACFHQRDYKNPIYLLLHRLWVIGSEHFSHMQERTLHGSNCTVYIVTYHPE